MDSSQDRLGSRADQRNGPLHHGQRAGRGGDRCDRLDPPCRGRGRRSAAVRGPRDRRGAGRPPSPRSHRLAGSRPRADARALAEGERTQALLQQAVRVLQIAWMVSITWLAARAFGMPIPAQAMAAYLPIVLVVGSLPVNVAGFGAVQLAWLRFTPWAPGEQVLAFSFVWQLLCGAAMILRGLPFMRRVIAEIDAGAPPRKNLSRRDRLYALAAAGHTLGSRLDPFDFVQFTLDSRARR